ncbi:MAG: hypothetical protein LUH53_03185, partial [Lachnospiraceae bacterium]|nr:hypothetical protein [Lachnospiraceae bacterium]
MGNENLLPKNIRQIGEIQGRRKIYLEDYVMTYIRKMENRGNDDFLGILLGERKCTEEAEYVFVRGIMEVPGETDGEQLKQKLRGMPEAGQTQREPRGAAVAEQAEEGKKTAGESVPEKEKTGLWQAFQKRYGTREDWAAEDDQGTAGKQEKQEGVADNVKTEEKVSMKSDQRKNGKDDSAIPKDRWERLRRDQAAHFPGSQVVGCCVIGTWETGQMEELTGQIPEAKQMLYHLQDQEERLYWLEGERYEGIAGYFVFYEQNRQMQEYLSELFGESSVEKESAPDNAIISFREKVKNKADEKSRSFLKLASSFFVVGALLVGVIAVNRVSDLRQTASVTGTTTASLEDGQGTVSDSGDTFSSASDSMSVSADAKSDAADQSDSADNVESVADAAENTADVSDILTGSDAFWAEDETDVSAAASESAVSSGASNDAGTASAADAGTD